MSTCIEVIHLYSDVKKQYIYSMILLLPSEESCLHNPHVKNTAYVLLVETATGKTGVVS